MKYALLPLLLLLSVSPALANDHQWCYDSSIWAADLARGQALAQVMRCDPALIAEARREFGQIDQESLSAHMYVHQLRSPAPAQPAPPRPGR